MKVTSLHAILREGIPAVLSRSFMCPYFILALILVHGGWGGWSAFSTCSQTCDGTETRARVCDNPSPANGGEPCHGDTDETQACNTDICITGKFCSLSDSQNFDFSVVHLFTCFYAYLLENMSKSAAIFLRAVV